MNYPSLCIIFISSMIGLIVGLFINDHINRKEIKDLMAIQHTLMGDNLKLMQSNTSLMTDNMQLMKDYDELKEACDEMYRMFADDVLKESILKGGQR